MARSVDLQTLRRRARELANRENDDTTDGFVDNTEIDGYINASLGAWHGFVAKAVPERYEKEQTIVADGSSSYALPSDHYQTIGVDYEFTSNCRMGLRRLMVQERNAYDTSVNSQAEGYRLKGTTLVLYPIPDSGTYYHVYITAAPTLVNTTDSFDGVNGWEEWIVYDVAIKILLKEGSLEEANLLIAERNKIQAEMEAAASEREAAQPSRVVDTRTGGGRRFDPDFWAGR